MLLLSVANPTGFRVTNPKTAIVSRIEIVIL